MRDRRNIYYWKCDREATFHGAADLFSASVWKSVEMALRPILQRRMSSPDMTIRSADGQGNHLTYLASDGLATYFVKVENGPEQDDYFEVEARVLDEVRAAGVPAPRVFLTDVSRTEAPFAFQVIEFFPCPDMNRLYKEDRLPLAAIAAQIGRCLARWQSNRLPGFGPFDPAMLRVRNQLMGLHKSYEDYFLLNWETHLSFLVVHEFLSIAEADTVRRLVHDHAFLLQLEQGCLVHKDLALWNILGTPRDIKAFIDWDDAISGDPTDDLSLLACFHSANVINAAVSGYQSVCALPTAFAARFWLHLLRNMVVKAVIRIGSGYFERQDDFFLIPPGGTARNLKDFTRERLFTACRGLQEQKDVTEL